MDFSKFKKDFFWYSLGAIIPIIINIIKMPIFTRYFSPNDFGYFALINTTYSYMNLFAFSWVLSCVWRYYINKKNNNKLSEFYTNIVVLLIIGTCIVTIITIIWVITTSDSLGRKLIFANYLNLITLAITSLYLIIIRLDGKSLKYNVYTIIISISSFALLFVLIYLLNNTIESMLNCNNTINIIFTIFIIYKFNKNYSINRKHISKRSIKELISYGFGAIFIQISLLVLISSDRYIIKFFYSTDKVGIYNQIYNLAQISIVALVTIFFNIINPELFKLYEKDISNEKDFYKYVFLYISCLLPLVVYFSLYSKQISILLLGEQFRVGYKMMPYIMISCFLYGLCDMHQDRMKFKNKLKYICKNIILAALINLVLNILMTPRFGYEFASITTLISYIFLYLINIYYDSPSREKMLIIVRDKYKLIKIIFVVLILQLIFHKIMSDLFLYCNSLTYSILEGFLFLVIYIICVYKKLKYMMIS